MRTLCLNIPTPKNSTTSVKKDSKEENYAFLFNNRNLIYHRFYAYCFPIAMAVD